MPKKIEEWHQLEKPKTPSQINHFFNLCAKWLVLDPLDVQQETSFFKNSWAPSVCIETPSLGISSEDLNNQLVQKCFFCSETKNVRSIIANPFARKNMVLVCSECVVPE